MTNIHIVIPIFQGVTHLDFTGPHQVLSRLPGSVMTVASMEGNDVEADGLVFTGLASLASIEECDVLCVPGGPGTTEAMLDPRFVAEIRRLGLTAKFITSVCTGSLLLGAAGFLHGRKAATHWGSRDLLPHFGAVISERRVERDGNVLTGGGVTAGIDFALTLAAELKGDEVAQRIQLSLEYAPAPPFNSGRPETAPADIVASIRIALAKTENERHDAANRAAKSAISAC